MAISTIKMARMTIHGSMLTERARERMGDGDWKGALNFLVDSLEGMTYDQAISVIDGRTRLTGEGATITMVEEDPKVAAELHERYKSEYSYGQYVRSGDLMYEPYRVIDNLGPKDADIVFEMPEFKERNMTMFTRYPEWISEMGTVDSKSCYQPILPAKTLEMRAMHYADEPKTDKALMLRNGADRNVVVLFRRVAEGVTPFWREKDNYCFASAYATAASFLPAGGFAQHYGYVHPNDVKAVQKSSAPAPEAFEVTREREARIAAEDAAAAENAARHAAEAIALRESIVAFADTDAEYGWQEYRWKDETDGTYMTLRAPKRALHCYALSQTTAHKLMPEYKAFSPDSFKTSDDNQYHTDVWLGCGFALDANTYKHDSREYRAILDLMFEVQRTLLNFEVQVLARGPEVTGKVVFFDTPEIDKSCILVVPHAGVEFELQAMAAGAVISEAGGRLAHLVTVCREQSKPILRMDGACSTFRVGQSLTVHPETGRVTIWP
jgi:phosphohistidine swiveling domain-containing protein